MNKEITPINLYRKIKNLPDEILEQVSDYIDFLMVKSRIELNPIEEISNQERQILDDRYKESGQIDIRMISLEELKDKLLKKYRT